MAGSKKSKAKKTSKSPVKRPLKSPARRKPSAQTGSAPSARSSRKKVGSKVASKTAPVSKSKAQTAKSTRTKASKPSAAKKGGKVSLKQAQVKTSSRKTGKSSKGASRPAPKAAPKAKAKAPAAQPAGKPIKFSQTFLDKQRHKLLVLKDAILDVIHGVARDNLHARAEGSEASAFGLHQADAGSDAYDRDFALGQLSKDQDSLYQIDEALKRIELGTYGICEMSGKPILQRRLEVLPFARYTVECQAELEKQNRLQGVRQPVTPLFGSHDEEGEDGEDDGHDNKD